MRLAPRLPALPAVEGWPRRRIAWTGGLFIAAIAALAAYDMWRSRGETIALAERELAVQARVIAEQTTRSLQSVDTVLRHLAEQHRRGVLQRYTPEELHAYMKEQAIGLVQVDGLIVFGPDGLGRASSVVPPSAVGKVDVRRIETFYRLREEPVLRMMVGTTIRAPGTGRWVFPIGRRLEGSGGDFEGVVGAGGQVEYFQRFYRDTYPEPGTHIALWHRNTTLMARHPPADAMLGRKVAPLAALFEQAARGVTVTRSSGWDDGVDRFAAVRAVQDHPLFVVVTRDAADVLAPWRSQAIGTAWRTLALGTLAALLLALLWRQLSRLGAAQASLVQSEERYALAAAGSDTGVWDWDFAAGTAYESRRARELQGLPLAPEVQPLEELRALLTVHPDDAARRDAALLAHLEGGAPHYEVEYRVRRADGSAEGRYGWVHVRALCTRDAAGRPLRLAGSVSDIDDRKREEAGRERLEQQLRQAQKLEAIGTLAGGIAHDFNNILSAILGYGELAQKGAAEGSAQRGHIDSALAAGQRAKSLVERILAFSRSGMGERVPVNVQSVVAEALHGIAATLPAGVHIERRLEAGDNAVLGDPTQIHQVVMNLCANAVHAMRGEGRLTVALEAVHLAAPLVLATSTLEPGRYLRLSVADTGGGIEPRLLQRIFDPFFTTKEVGVGTGLGLSLVHGIVTDLGGGIDVSSRVGEGSTFTIHLPSVSATAAPAAAGDEGEGPRGSGQTVLVVDDEEPLVRLNEELLATLGYEPVGFVSSAAALEALRADPQRFDLLLSDEAMPGLTGSELALEARRLRPGLPVLLMTGFASPALLQRAREAGVAEVLGKPLAARDLARALAAALQTDPGTGAALQR